jgi:iron(III) transport system permease protein
MEAAGEQPTLTHHRIWRPFYPGLRPEALLPLVLCGLLLMLIGAPVISVILSSLRTGLPGRQSALTVTNYLQVFSEPGTYGVLLNTFWFAAGTLIVTFLFTLPTVWFMNRTDLPFKRAFYVLMSLVILLPVFLKVIGWVVLASPNIGILNELARNIFGLDRPLFNIYSIPFMGFIQGISFVPLAFFMLSAAYQAMDPALEEAAYTGGVGKFKTLLKINVPITLPAVLAVFIYVTVLAITVFETPALLGLPGRIFVLSSRIYFAVSPQASLPNYGLASAYGAILLVAAFAFSYIYFRVLRQGRKYAVVTGRGYRPKLLELGKWKPLAVAFVLLYFSLALFFPFVALVWTSLLPYFQVPSMEALSQITLNNYINYREYAPLGPFINTGILIVFVPTLAVLVSILVSWVVVRTQFRFRGFLDTVAFLPHATPHILLAVALAYLALLHPNILPIYNTMWIIILAQVISYIAYGTRTMNSAMIQVHRELEEVGKVSGASTLTILRAIIVPLVGPAVLNAWLWIMLLSYREVTMALTLQGPGNMVVSTLVWQLWINGWLPQVCALGVVIILSMAALVIVFRILFGSRLVVGSGS